MAKVLIVDDLPANREYLAVLLGYAGHTVIEANDGLEGLAKVRQERPDLVVTDILMPAMDGYEFVREIRKDPSIANTRVIFCTAHYLETEAVRLAELGGVMRIIAKPAEPQTILRAVRDLLAAGSPEARSVELDHDRQREFDREHLRLVTDKLSTKSDELSRTNHRLKALLETTRKLASNYDPLKLIAEYCRAARDICEARYAGAGIPDADGRELLHFITSGVDKAVEKPPLSGNVFGRILNDGQPVRVHVPAEAAGSLGLPADHPPAGSLLLVPIVSSGTVKGFLYLAGKTGGGQFDEGDEQIAASLAAQLGIYYDNARLFQELERNAAQLKANLRTHAELERQLLQAQKMEAVGRLAGGVAHDFNNILTVILGFGRILLQEGNLNTSGRDAAEEILKSGERAASLTRQLLAFSRSQVLQPKLLNLNEIIMGTGKMLRRLIGEDIELRHVLAADLGEIKADPGQVDQILMNLVVNARDAMPDGGTITIETRNIHLEQGAADSHMPVQPGDYAMLAISDNGHEMDAATRARLFEPFFTTKPRGKGTGLGLSTVYGIVKQSGGNLCVYSEPGRGTTFKIYLPLAAERIESGINAALCQSYQGKCRGTIVVLEDEPSVRMLAVKLLEHGGYKVHDFGTPDRAIEFFIHFDGNIDLLITDLVLPQMDGVRAAEAILRIRPAIQVLYMSGYTEHAVMRTQAFEDGTFFLGKPFTSAELLGKVDQVLSLAHA